MHEMLSSREPHFESKSPGFLSEVSNCLAHAKILDSQKKSRCSTQTTLYKQLSHREQFLSVRAEGTLLKSKFPAKDPPYKQGFQKIEVKAAMLLFSTHLMTIS